MGKNTVERIPEDFCRKTLNRPDTLIVAIGNDGREDDGLGWAFAASLEKTESYRGSIEYRYQLQVEDADLIRSFGRVLFVDASREALPDGFRLSLCLPAAETSFTTHSVSPPVILAVAGALFGDAPQAYLLGIQGYRWELKKGLSAEGRRNLARALAWVKKCS